MPEPEGIRRILFDVDGYSMPPTISPAAQSSKALVFGKPANPFFPAAVETTGGLPGVLEVQFGPMCSSIPLLICPAGGMEYCT